MIAGKEVCCGKSLKGLLSDGLFPVNQGGGGGQEVHSKWHQMTVTPRFCHLPLNEAKRRPLILQRWGHTQSQTDGCCQHSTVKGSSLSSLLPKSICLSHYLSAWKQKKFAQFAVDQEKPQMLRLVVSKENSSVCATTDPKFFDTGIFFSNSNKCMP